MKRGRLGVIVVACVTFALTSPVLARSHRSHRHHARAHSPLSKPARTVVPEKPPLGPYASALLIDADSGRVLFQRNSTTPRPPASMVKMMVALLTFEALERGDLRLDQRVPISLAASRTGGSGILLRAGETLSLEDLLKAMLVASANGASVAIAETVAGSQQAMIARMNARARELGMSETVYRTVNGLPPRPHAGPPDMTSASDLAILARKLLEHREVFRYSSRPVVPIRGGTVLLRNTNHLVGHMEGADGLKTGYFRKAGFNLTATATRKGMRLVAVVMGCPTLACRFLKARELMEWGFAHFSKVNVIEAGQPLRVEVKVANGATDRVRPVAAEGLSYVLGDEERRDVRVTFQLPATVSAPISRNQELGEIIIRDRRRILDVIPAISPTGIASSPVVSPAVATGIGIP
jgi:D-alanyl-D-alanine carboxypeptidase (penicillin-binding protein 5/6)